MADAGAAPGSPGPAVPMAGGLLRPGHPQQQQVGLLFVLWFAQFLWVCGLAVKDVFVRLYPCSKLSLVLSLPSFWVSDPRRSINAWQPLSPSRLCPKPWVGPPPPAPNSRSVQPEPTQSRAGPGVLGARPPQQVLAPGLGSALPRGLQRSCHRTPSSQQ